MGNARACLDYLREADGLLDSAPRTAAAEQAAAASDRVTGAAMIGGVVGAALVAAARQHSDLGGPATPGAARELAEAVEVLRKAAAELGDHPATAHLQQEIGRWERAPLPVAAKGLAAMVCHLHPKLRAEFGLMEAPPLTNWAVNDPEDDAALHAAGLGFRSKAIKIAIVVSLVVGFYVFLFTR